MSAHQSKLPDQSRAAFERYIQELDEEYLPWYTKASKRNKVWLVFGQSAALIATCATAFVAGLADAEMFKNVQWLLVLLPLIGAFATTMLAQTRVREILSLRESGREAVQALVSQAKADFAALATDAECAVAHKNLVAEISRIEKMQATNLLAIAGQIGK